MKTIQIPHIVILMVFVSLSSLAQENPEKKSVDEIAKEMSNPTLPMFNLAMFYDYQNMTGSLTGADQQNINLFAAQPPLPFPLKKMNLIIRPLLSFTLAQPVYTEEGFESAGAVNFGDIPIDILLATTSKKGVMFGGGLVANIPTASSEEIRGEWGIGPSLLLGLIRKHVFVIVLNNRFDVSGDNKQAVLGGQYVVAFSLKGGWQIVASPPFSYNWETKALTLPIGGGPFRTVMVGNTPVKVGLQFNYYVSQADPFGPKWGLRFNVTPRLKRPW